MKGITNKNPSFRSESEGRVRHFSFRWIGGGFNDVWAANKYDAIILANSWFNQNADVKKLIVDEGSVKDVTGVPTNRWGW